MTRWVSIPAAALALQSGFVSTPAEAARIVAPAQPRVDPQTLIAGRDYPASALRAGEQGTVRYVLDIGVDGRVKGCKVVQSSGSTSLDAHTCRIMTARGRFTPAVDSEGNPAQSQEVQAVAWSLPAEARVVHWGYGMVSNSSPPSMAIVTHSLPIVHPPSIVIPQHGPGEAELSVWTPGSMEMPTLGRFGSIPACRRAMAKLKLSGGQKAYCTIAPEQHRPGLH